MSFVKVHKGATEFLTISVIKSVQNSKLTKELISIASIKGTEN